MDGEWSSLDVWARRYKAYDSKGCLTLVRGMVFFFDGVDCFVAK